MCGTAALAVGDAGYGFIKIATTYTRSARFYVPKFYWLSFQR